MLQKYSPYFILAFLGGVAVRSFFNIPQNFVLATTGMTAGLLIVLFFSAKLVTHPPTPSLTLREGEKREFTNENSRHNEFSWLTVWAILLFLFLGMLRFSFFENNIVKDELHNHYGEEIAITGNVISNTIKNNFARILLETTKGRILIIKRIYPQYQYGDVLKVFGKLTEPENSADFDFKKYLAKDLVYSEMFFPTIEKIKYTPKSGSLAFLFFLKDKFEDNLRKILPEPHSSLADGMLLGNEGVLSSDLINAFRKTGTIHMLVLSGYNITVVGVFIMAILAFFAPPFVAWSASLLGILAFTLMSGAAPAAVRSAIMAVIGLLAFRSGRKSVAILALLWAALIMVIYNPMLLRFDRGFQLSFLATLGLIVASPFFKKIFWFLPNFASLRESAAASLAAQIFVLPLLLSWGGEISWLSPLANIIIVGVVPIIMFFSFFGALGFFLFHFLGELIATPAYFLISWQLFFVKFFADLPHTTIQFNFFPIFLLSMIYAALFYWAVKYYAKVS